MGVKMLKLITLNPKDFFSPFYRKKRIILSEFEEFKRTFDKYNKDLNLNLNQSEDALVANVLNPFLQALGFETMVKSKQKGKSEVDLLIKKQGTSQVIIEAKKQGNKEMIKRDDINCKALHESILYYLRQRYTDGGGGIK